MPATRRLILIILVLFFFLLFLAVPGVSWSQTPPNPWQDPARELAKKVVAITGARQTFALTVRNISSLSDSEVAAVRAALEAELRAAGMRLAAKSNGGPELRITLSENLQGLLWVAEIVREGASDVAMVILQKGSERALHAAKQTVVLQTKLIWEQDGRFIDLAFTDSLDAAVAKQAVLLEPRRLVYLRKVNDDWQEQHSLDLPAPKLVSRDPRAIMLLREAILLFLPDHICQAAIEFPSKLECWDRGSNVPILTKAEEAALEVRPVSGKNYFVKKPYGAGDPSPREDSFYESVGVLGRGIFLQIVAATDGRAIFSRPDDRNVAATSVLGWGSQLMAVDKPCGQGSLLLVTGSEDWTAADTIQAFELQGMKPVPASNRVLLPGPILEFQAGAAPTVNAIIRNLKTGRYEAYTLTLSCGR